MTTEQELKDRCSPESIKWTCKLAEGFEIIDNCLYFNKLPYTDNIVKITGSNFLFPLLIYRALEGWNKIDVENQIRIDGDEVYIPTWELGESSCKYFKKAIDYQPQSLTHAECACLHCLLDIFEEEEKYYKGEIKELKKYDHFLTDEEIKEEYNKRNE